MTQEDIDRIARKIELDLQLSDTPFDRRVRRVSWTDTVTFYVRDDRGRAVATIVVGP